MNSINFKTNSLIKNFKNTIKALHHCKCDSKTYFRYKSKLNIDKNVDMHIKQIISEMMSEEVIVNNFSKKYIITNVISILEEIHDKNGFNLNNNDFKNLYLNLIRDFENEINNTIENEFKEFEFISHIDNLKLSREIKIADVILFPYDSSISDLAYINDNEYVSDDFFRDDEVYARTCVYGSKDYAIKKSEVKIKMALNILKFLLPGHLTNFNLDGETVKNVFRDYIFLNSNELFGGGARKVGDFHFCCDIDDELLKGMSFNLEILSSLFKNNNRFTFENNLLSAIYWFGEAVSQGMMKYRDADNKYSTELDNFEYFNAYPKLLNLIISLETVFIYGNEDKSKSISSKVSALIANPGYEEFISEFLKEIYINRSKIVHSGIVYISKDDLNTLVNYTRAAIFKIAVINHLNRDKISYFNKIYGVI
ncbi:HEPN domain-containing protein [uncultured Methanobrevibacter sp.]|uniref:HEPN domain-containing protein n=1 Tax=uncultured Methanobrevibacter sp. TaxID=253161 RepID=UPI0025D80417|nr:HEPN domain-containing protein [uncultured Methanobrevibacter sp.]